MKGIILLGDATTHGGVVISAQHNYTVGGRAVACVGDKVACPVPGHGVNVIVEGEPTMQINGKAVALHGHRCACGCQLIASTTTHLHA